MTRRTYVTIGAGQAAAVAARTLRRRGFDGRIVLIGDEPHPPYQRPPLSKEFLAGVDGEDSLWILPPKWVADNDIDIVTGASVARVDTLSGAVELDGGAPVAADAVLFATGGSARRLTVPGPRPDLVHYLRTLEDARRLAPLLTPGRRLALIGGGFIGLEIAATAASSGAAVTVVETDPVPLGRIVGPQMGELVAQLHRDNGIDIRCGAPVSGVRTTAEGVLIDIEGAAAPVEADAVVVGIGMVPNVGTAIASGLQVDNGIVVDAAGRTSVPNVYAAGDVARRFSARAGRHVRLEHFDNASRQGAAVAHAMLGRDAVCDEPNWFWSDQFGRNLQFVGTARGEPVIRGDRDTLEFTAFYFDGGTLCGAFTVERGEDIAAARELLGRTVDASTLCDDDVDLFDLVYDEEPELEAQVRT
ncbi:Rhodocoxin reductase [Mycolicibacterium vanbaalenii]|uniref:Rhodocoxin reductase n=1 Tax=Mycolicibacterium vanbaalenii TaxID=110539 RepID=A0A5S9QH68_MYCVN|nr:FAD-dependent oxidoreductase [Mycolicibacterium vanbaalenii]CAA0117370.1 Rhodocoxin reductase [Mycolicibacterium vanbaalenii]